MLVLTHPLEYPLLFFKSDIPAAGLTRLSHDKFYNDFLLILYITTLSIAAYGLLVSQTVQKLVLTEVECIFSILKRCMCTHLFIKILMSQNVFPSVINK
jgi:hypothetical protein